MAKHEMRIMGRSGDERVEWDVDVAEEVSLAEEFFGAKIVEGFAAFTAPPKVEDGERIYEFDPAQERIVLVPPISGG